MKRDRKNISKLLASLIISSSALFGGVFPISAMEQQERVSTQNKLCELLQGLNTEQQKKLVEILNYGIGQFMVNKALHLDFANFSENFTNFAAGQENDVLINRGRLYFNDLDAKWNETSSDDRRNVLKMLDEAKKIASTSQPLLTNLRNYVPPQVELEEQNLEPAIFDLNDFEIQFAEETQSINKDDVCAICLDRFENGPYLTLPCKHSAHKGCFKAWLEKQNVCPICKTVVNPRTHNQASVLIESQKLIQ